MKRTEREKEKGEREIFLGNSPHARENTGFSYAWGLGDFRNADVENRMRSCPMVEIHLAEGTRGGN